MFFWNSGQSARSGMSFSINSQSQRFAFYYKHQAHNVWFNRAVGIKSNGIFWTAYFQRAQISWSIKSMFKESKHRRENNSQELWVIQNRARTRQSVADSPKILPYFTTLESRQPRASNKDRFNLQLCPNSKQSVKKKNTTGVQKTTTDFIQTVVDFIAQSSPSLVFMIHFLCTNSNFVFLIKGQFRFK